MRQELHSREQATARPPADRLPCPPRCRSPRASRCAVRDATRARAGGASLSSPEIETGMENLSLDMGLGYTEREQVGARALQVWPQ